MLELRPQFRVNQLLRVTQACAVKNEGWEESSPLQGRGSPSPFCSLPASSHRLALQGEEQSGERGMEGGHRGRERRREQGREGGVVWRGRLRDKRRGAPGLSVARRAMPGGMEERYSKAETLALRRKHIG